MRRATNVIYVVDQPISSPSHDPCTRATKFATRRNSRSEQDGRWLAGEKLYKECI